MIATILLTTIVSAHPIAQMVRDIRASNIEHTIKTLVGFGTRNTLSSQDDPKRGIGAARDWIYGEFQKIAATSGGRMTVELQTFEQAPGRFTRIKSATKLTNVVATLHGTSDRTYVISGHYDSMCSSPTDATCDAPGANDDASGVAAVLEAARVMAPHQFEGTIVFMAVAGEEQGLVGSTYYAEQAKKIGTNIDAMFTNDIVGGDGRDQHTLRVFSEGIPTSETTAEARTRRTVGGENDGPSRQLARFIVETAERYVPSFHVKMIYRRDRYLRSGDHVPFLEQGYTAVRLTELRENYKHQHQNVRIEDGAQYGDLPQFADLNFIASVARVNTAAIATLASAPAAPRDVHILTERLTNDTDLQWADSNDPNLDHYEVVWRDTAAAAWTHSKDIGRVTKYTAPDMSKDNYFFGVRAVSKSGDRSVVAFPTPFRPAPAPLPGGGAAVREPARIDEPALSAELNAMAREDQELRSRWIKDRQNQALSDEVSALDAKHVARLREIIKAHAWPTFSMVGARAANDAWLIAQHGGPEFLHETLPLMKQALDAGEMLGTNYATSVDRTRVQDGQKQVYGSQFDTQDGKCEPLPIEDPDHVDDRRKAVGLGPLAEYTKTLCETYRKKP